MPFDESFNDNYALGIKKAVIANKAYCERVDEQHFQERILDRIYNQISKADVIIADMSGRNANVFYEVGYAHALGKRVILLTKAASDIPFDLNQYPHIIYGNSISVLKSELTKKLRAVLKNPVPSPHLSGDGLDIWISDIAINEMAFYRPYGSSPKIQVQVTNNSNQIHEHSATKAAFIFPYPPSETLSIVGKGTPYLNLPDKSTMIQCGVVPNLFPGEVAPIELDLAPVEQWPSDLFEVDFRLYTQAGMIDRTISVQFDHYTEDD